VTALNLTLGGMLWTVSPLKFAGHNPHNLLYWNFVDVNYITTTRVSCEHCCTQAEVHWVPLYRQKECASFVAVALRRP